MGADAGEGRYLYAIVRCDREEFLGDIGLDGSEVWALPYREIAAAIHRCDARPYVSDSEDRIKDWVIEHNYVIDVATERFGTVLPFSFDVILRGDDKAVRDWIESRYESLTTELDRLSGKAEYSVQLFCDESVLQEEILNEDPDLLDQRKAIEGQPRGSSYLLSRKIEMKLRDALRLRMAEFEEEIEKAVEDLVDGMQVLPRTTATQDERFKGKRLVSSICCLMSEDQVPVLGRALDEMNSIKGLSVRFTGPWAPFSFARLSEDE